MKNYFSQLYEKATAYKRKLGPYLAHMSHCRQPAVRSSVRHMEGLSPGGILAHVMIC